MAFITPSRDFNYDDEDCTGEPQSIRRLIGDRINPYVVGFDNIDRKAGSISKLKCVIYRFGHNMALAAFGKSSLFILFNY